MSYRTVNEFSHFIWKDAHIGGVEASEGLFRISLDGVSILPENSKNRDIRTMRCNGLVLSVTDPSDLFVVREGYRLFDPDGKLLSVFEDETVPAPEQPAVWEAVSDGYVYDITCTGCVYEMILDGTDDRTYALSVRGSGDREEWEKFLSPEE